MSSVTPTPAATPDFAARVIAWQRRAGRHALPWQGTRDAYRVWLSEIMLQQTQVSAVIGYYTRFLAAFPTVQALAAASDDAVMAQWAGLGYYSRARNLHRCAQRVVAEHDGRFPDRPEALADLPGIGRSTAAAIAAFAYGKRAAILDGNVKRVFARVWGIDGDPTRKAVESAMWTLAEALLPAGDGIEAYTQGLMDLGATVCTRGRPRCLDDAGACPLVDRCIARREGRTATLPTPRPRKTVPLRQAVLLILRDGDRLLLEKRPPSGVWGGLWSLPQIDAADVGDWPTAILGHWLDTARRLGGPVRQATPLPEREHVFTHFRLRMLPLLVDCAPTAALAADASRAWLDAPQWRARGLPAPVARLLGDAL